MGGTDEFDLKKFLKEIDEAIPKYKKTLKFLQDQITKAEFPIEEELEEEAQKIENTIANLELTKKIYTSDLPQEVVVEEALEEALEEVVEEVVEEEIPEDVEKEQLKTFSIDAILAYPSLNAGIERLARGQETDRHTATIRHKESKKSNLLYLVLGVVLGSIGSYIVTIATRPELPQIIFTNGTIIYP